MVLKVEMVDLEFKIMEQSPIFQMHRIYPEIMVLCILPEILLQIIILLSMEIQAMDNCLLLLIFL